MIVEERPPSSGTVGSSGEPCIYLRWFRRYRCRPSAVRRRCVARPREDCGDSSSKLVHELSLAPPATLASHAESSRSTTGGSPLRCHPAFVDAFMMNAPDFQSCHAVESQAQRSRSAGVSFGRFTERCKTPVWCRDTRISKRSAARLRKEADSEAIRAVNMCPKGNRTMSENSQSVSAIGVYENHSGLPTTQPPGKRCSHAFQPRPLTPMRRATSSAQLLIQSKGWGPLILSRLPACENPVAGRRRSFTGNLHVASKLFWCLSANINLTSARLSAQAILNNVGGRFAAWQNLSTD